jgi:uncharacterized damage-inducible protein DinB
LLGILDTIEKSGQDLPKVLAWRPGPGRAHIAWQAMHCAATHDRYINVNLKKGSPKDESLVTHFAGGSTPSDSLVPALPEIRQTLSAHYKDFRDYIASLRNEDLAAKTVGRDGKERTLGEVIILLTWHEAHHQGQIHLTWNLYKAANNLK